MFHGMGGSFYAIALGIVANFRPGRIAPSNGTSMRWADASSGMSITRHSAVLFCAAAKSPLLAIHSVLTGHQRSRSIEAVSLTTLKVKGSHALPVSREAGAKPALPRNCKRNEICGDH